MSISFKQLFVSKVAKSSFLPLANNQSRRCTHKSVEEETDNEELSLFGCIKGQPPLEAITLNELFEKDDFEQKANCAIGVYSGPDGGPFVLPVVKKSQTHLIADRKLIHEHLPVLGDPEYTRLASQLVLGKCSPALIEKRALPIHTVACAGALRLAGDFLVRVMKMDSALVPCPTWESHREILQYAGFTNIKDYFFWDKKKHHMSFSNILTQFAEAPDGSLVLLHACAQNPTGCDPSNEQWMEIAELIRVKKHFPLFDIAYHGFASGDFDNDAWAVRYFVEQGLELMIAQSFSKCMGLYSERVGCLTVILKDSKKLKDIASLIATIIRANYYTPPAHGARTVKRILADPMLRKEWLKTFKHMYTHVHNTRVAFAKYMMDLKTPLKWDHVAKQVGLFTLTDLTQEMITKLVHERHVYMLSNGRLNLCGLNKRNIQYVAEAIDQTVRELINKDADCS